MRKLVLLLILLTISGRVFASECTNYLCDIYSKVYDQKVKIVSKEEFEDCYEYKVGEYYVSSIVYGFGYMKRPKCRRERITYLTLFDSDGNPIWGYVIPR